MCPLRTDNGRPAVRRAVADPARADLDRGEPVRPRPGMAQLIGSNRLPASESRIGPTPRDDEDKGL